MNTLYLRYAVEIEKTRSITQAAENLYMAQPNLSKAVKELETSLRRYPHRTGYKISQLCKTDSYTK